MSLMVWRRIGGLPAPTGAGFLTSTSDGDVIIPAFLVPVIIIAWQVRIAIELRIKLC